MITDVHKRMQGRWTPSDFIADYGSRRVVVLDCTDGAGDSTRRSTMAEFFTLLLSPSSTQYYKIKVRMSVLPFSVLTDGNLGLARGRTLPVRLSTAVRGVLQEHPLCRHDVSERCLEPCGTLRRQSRCSGFGSQSLFLSHHRSG